MNTSVRLFVMMVLQLAIWGAWAPKIFPYMGMLGFAPWQQSLVGSAWGVAALVGIFFSNQFADRNFAAERFLAASHLIGGLALVGTAFATSFWPFFACYLIFSLVYVPTLSVTNSIAFANLKDPAAGFGAGAEQDVHGGIAAIVEDHVGQTAIGPLEDLVGVVPVFLEAFTLDREHRRAGFRDGGGGVVLGREDVARRPADLGAQRRQADGCAWPIRSPSESPQCAAGAAPY